LNQKLEAARLVVRNKELESELESVRSENQEYREQGRRIRNDREEMSRVNNQLRAKVTELANELQYLKQHTTGGFTQPPFVSMYEDESDIEKFKRMHEGHI
jgi:chromosome segregation ATPase